MATTELSIMRFPAQDVIVAYLTKHTLTSDPYLVEKKIIEAVAKFFANQDKEPIGVDLGVALETMSLSKKLGLSTMSLAHLNENLAKALKDCAAGKAI